MKQSAPKRQHARPIRRRALGEEQHRQPTPVCLRHRRIYSRPRLWTAAALNIDSSCARRNPSHHWPAPNLSLCHHYERPHRAIDQNVQIAQVVRYHGTSAGNPAFYPAPETHRPHDPPAPTVNPDRPLSADLRSAYPPFNRGRRQQRQKDPASPNRPNHSPQLPTNTHFNVPQEISSPLADAASADRAASRNRSS